jgi:hypothetical protein
MPAFVQQIEWSIRKIDFYFCVISIIKFPCTIGCIIAFCSNDSSIFFEYKCKATKYRSLISGAYKRTYRKAAELAVAGNGVDGLVSSFLQAENWTTIRQRIERLMIRFRSVCIVL